MKTFKTILVLCAVIAISSAMLAEETQARDDIMDFEYQQDMVEAEQLLDEIEDLLFQGDEE